MKIITILYKNREFTLPNEVELQKFLSNKDKKEMNKILIEFGDLLVTGLEYNNHRQR